MYEFLTTEFHLPPGIIAQLYRLRWDIEKFFDVCENLLAEKRAWGVGPVPAQVQNEFLVLTHNLLLLLSGRLEVEEGIRDEKVEIKYEAALKVRDAAARLKGRKVSPWVRVLRQITRWSSQFTRWIQDAIVHGWEWDAGVAKLAPLMRRLHALRADGAIGRRLHDPPYTENPRPLQTDQCERLDTIHSRL